MTELGREDDTGIMRDGTILSGERGWDRAVFGGKGFGFGELEGLGVRSVSAETVEFFGGFCRSGMVFRSLRDVGECLFNVLSRGGAGAGTFGGGGKGGGNFPRRKPLSVLSVTPARPVSPSPISTRSVELDLTSERNSRSSPERVNELRGEGDDKRGRENRLRKRDTADPGTFVSSSCVTGSAGGNTRLKVDDKEATRT